MVEQRREDRYRIGPTGAFRFWWEVAWDTARTGLRLRMRAVREGLTVLLPGGRATLDRPSTQTSASSVAKRGQWGWHVGVVTQDLGYVRRSLAGSPAYALVAVTTLAVAIGANTAIFSVLKGIVLSPLPYDDPGALYAVLVEEQGPPANSSSWPAFQDYQSRSDLFAGVIGAVHYSIDVRWEKEAEELRAAAVTAGTWETLGVVPQIGRGFASDEDRIGGPRTVILSDGLWARRFGRDPTVPGRSMSIGGESHTIVGVLPRGVEFPTADVELWTPVREAEAIEGAGFDRLSRTIGFMRAYVRLRPGIDATRAGEELSAQSSRVHAAEGLEPLDRITLRPLHDEVVGDVRGTMFMVFAAVGLVLLVACTNMAGLALTRATIRHREMAVRTALGASRSRLVGQLVTESTVLALAGGLVGVFLAQALVKVLADLAPADLPRMQDVRLDAVVLAFTAAVSALAGLSSGLIPALVSSRPDLQVALRNGDRSVSGPGSFRLQHGLVIGQVALAVILVTGAGLLTNSFIRLLSVETGFESAGLVRVGTSLPEDEYPDPDASVAFYDQLLERIRSLPGVMAASATYSPPLSSNELRQTIVVEGQSGSEDDPFWAGAVIVQDDYFHTIGVEIVQGRDFGAEDGPDDPLVAVVNETLAARVWPGQDPLGRRFDITGGIRGSVDRIDRQSHPDQPLTVVGVVSDVRRSSLAQPPEPEFYRPHSQLGWRSLFLVIRAESDPLDLAGAVRLAISEQDRRVAIREIVGMDRVVSRSLAAPRFHTLLMAGFAATACLLAMIGVYAVMAFAVARRTREIGIRMALGAGADHVRRQVLVRGLGIAAWGMALGLTAAAAGSRLLARMLFEISPTDPATFLGVAGGIAGITLAASYIPARRASRVDPARSIKVE